MMMLLHAPQDFGDDRQEPRELTEKDLLSGSSEMLFIAAESMPRKTSSDLIQCYFALRLPQSQRLSG